MERESKFYLRLDLQVEAEDGTEIVRIVSNFLNDLEKPPGIKNITLMGMGIGLVGADVGHVRQNIAPVPIQPLEVTAEASNVWGPGKQEALEKLLSLAKSSEGEAIRYGTDELADFFPCIIREKLYSWERQGYIHPELLRGGKRLYR